MQGGAAVLACPWRSWSCSVECRRTGLFCFSVRNPPPAPLPPRQEQTSVALLLLQAGKFCGSFGWKWAELQPSSCHLPCNLCSFPDSHLHCQKWASSRLLPAGLPPSQRGRALPGPARGAGSSLPSLCPVPAGCTASSSFAFILLAVPHPVITAVRVSPENTRLWLTAGWGAEGTGSLQPAHPWVKRTDF